MAIFVRFCMPKKSGKKSPNTNETSAARPPKDKRVGKQPPPAKRQGADARGKLDFLRTAKRRTGFARGERGLCREGIYRTGRRWSPTTAAHIAKTPAYGEAGTVYARKGLDGPSEPEQTEATVAWLKANKPGALDSKVEAVFRTRGHGIIWRHPPTARSSSPSSLPGARRSSGRQGCISPPAI